MLISGNSRQKNHRFPRFIGLHAQRGSYLPITRELPEINIQIYTFLKSALKSASNGLQHDHFENFLYQAPVFEKMPKAIDFLLSKINEFFLVIIHIDCNEESHTLD